MKNKSGQAVVGAVIIVAVLGLMFGTSTRRGVTKENGKTIWAKMLNK